MKNKYGSFLLGFGLGTAFGIVILVANIFWSHTLHDYWIANLKLWQAQEARYNIGRQIVQESFPLIEGAKTLLHSDFQRSLRGTTEFRLEGIADDHLIVVQVPITRMNLLRTKAREFGEPEMRMFEIVAVAEVPDSTWHPDDPTRKELLFVNRRTLIVEIINNEGTLIDLQALERLVGTQDRSANQAR